jgi:hypothetical protein
MSTQKCPDGCCQINTGTYLCVVCGCRYVAPTESVCGARKCGDYNMLKCVRENGHGGEHNYVVDRERDYPHNRRAVRS